MLSAGRGERAITNTIRENRDLVSHKGEILPEQRLQEVRKKVGTQVLNVPVLALVTQ